MIPEDFKAFIGLTLIDITITEDMITLLFEDESNDCTLIIKGEVWYDCNNPEGE